MQEPDGQEFHRERVFLEEGTSKHLTDSTTFHGVSSFDSTTNKSRTMIVNPIEITLDIRTELLEFLTMLASRRLQMK